MYLFNQKNIKYRLTACIIALFLLVTSSPLIAEAISQSTFDGALASLRNTYPNYSTWNGTYAGGKQCWGFARLVADNVFGGSWSSWPRVNSISGVKKGDIVQYGNTSGSGHTIFVTGVSGDTIVFVDCNGNGNYSGGSKVRSCGIKWDNTISKGAKMFGKYSFSYLLSSPGIDGGGNNTPDPGPDPGPDPQPSGHSPVGVVDEIYVKNGNSIYIRGWAFDPDDQNHNVMLEAYIDTTRENATAGSGYQFRCTKDRPDVKSAYSLTGSTYYGFEDTHATSLNGGHVIYVYATNQVGGGDHALLGTYTLNFRDVHLPYGSIDLIEGGNGTLRIAGWAKDDDAPDSPVTVHVYIGGPAGSGANAYGIKAEGYRKDVGNHAFDKVINVKEASEIGAKDIYIYWLNLGEGSGNPHIVKQATIKSANHPYGFFDICEGGEGTIFVRGWAKDDDDPDACVEIHVYVGGLASDPASEGHIIKADYERSDVGKHGFNRTIAVGKTGEVDVNVYAINVGAGWSNKYLGKKTVTVTTKETVPPEISNVNVETDKDGYTVTCEVNDSVSSIDRVVFPTWTVANGQDDIAKNWSTADTVRGTIVDGVVSFRVNRSDHNGEYGTYRTHIYAYDKSGKEAKYVVPDIPYEHTVSIDANWGDSIPDSVPKYLGVDLVLPEETPVREGYFFAGYALDRNAEEADYQPGDLYTEEADVTLYAIWRSAVPDAVLPADLTEIEEKAFAGNAFTYVKIPEGVTKIGDKAFADCSKLKYVYIPSTVVTISDNAFDNAPKGLTIIGEPDSLAEYNAWINGFTFMSVE